MRFSEHGRTSTVTCSTSEATVTLASPRTSAFTLAATDLAGCISRAGELASPTCESSFAGALASGVLLVEGAGALSSTYTVLRGRTWHLACPTNEASLACTGSLAALDDAFSVASTNSLSLLVVLGTVELTCIATESNATVASALASREHTGFGACGTTDSSGDLVLGTRVFTLRPSESIRAAAEGLLAIGLCGTLAIATATGAFQVTALALEVGDTLAVLSVAPSKEFGGELFKGGH